MFYDIKDFPFLQEILNEVKSIVYEFEKNKSLDLLQDFILNEYPEISSHILHYAVDQKISKEDLGYDFRNESWGAFPIYKDGFGIKWYSVKDIFPVALSNALKTPNPYFSAFLKLAKKKSIKAHKHAGKHLIFHVCLNNLDGYSEIYCGDEKRVLKNIGDWVIFDTFTSHHSCNFSNTDRINFVVEFPYDFEKLNCKIEQ
jgi:aspartyl/asparaginyl beta-hydroxylase